MQYAAGFEQYGEQRIKGQWDSGFQGIVLFPSLPNTFKPCLGLNCLRNSGRNPEARILQHLGAHQLFFCSSATGCAGLSAEAGQKVTISLVYSRPGAHSLLDLPMSNMSLSW